MVVICGGDDGLQRHCQVDGDAFGDVGYGDSIEDRYSVGSNDKTGRR